MAVEHHREQELTFDVDPSWTLPDLHSAVPDGGRLEMATHELEATYFDTDRSTLRRLGFTMRRRSGGEDAGWHIKIPAEDARTEVQSKAAGSRPPAVLTRLVSGVVGGLRVGPVATIRTTRHTSRILNRDGQLVLEVAEDDVVGQRPEPDAAPVEWREVEVELGDGGSSADLDRLAALFSKAGARPAAVERKINHVLGEPTLAKLDGIPGLLVDYVREQCRRILIGDVLLRDDPSSAAVHKTRIAIRRLRSTMRLFSDAFFNIPEGFDDDLSWIAALLSPIRDGDILARRLVRETDQLSETDIVGPVRKEVTSALRRERTGAIAQWREAGKAERYQRILATLNDWYASVPVAPDAAVDAEKVLKKARRKVKRRLANADRPEDLHSARKAAKRLRYAADLLGQNITGAAKTAKKAKDAQTTLGDHQDLVVAAGWLRGRATSGEVQNGYTYGVLVARLEQEAVEIRRSL
jgi:CHAD domain-containing protein